MYQYVYFLFSNIVHDIVDGPQSSETMPAKNLDYSTPSSWIVRNDKSATTSRESVLSDGIGSAANCYCMTAFSLVLDSQSSTWTIPAWRIVTPLNSAYSPMRGCEHVLVEPAPGAVRLSSSRPTS